MKLLPDQTIKDWEEDEARAASGGMDGADASFLFFSTRSPFRLA
jgi:hypothetical protein